MKDGDATFLRSRSKPRYEGPDTIRIVDLFSGCGGMTLGAMEACRAHGLGCEVALAMEIDERIRAVYEANFSPSTKDELGNVRRRFEREVGGKLSAREKQTRKALGQVHLLLGGPPCQGHSSLNNHTRWTDPKNALYMRMVRAAEVLEPDMIVVENVPGVRRDEQRVLGRASRRLENLGYDVSDATVPVAAIGVPQLRIRHVLVASQHGRLPIAAALNAYRVPRHRSLRWALIALGKRNAESLLDSAARLSPENEKRARWLLRQDEYDLPNKLRPSCHRDAEHKYKSMYGRLRWAQPAQTITTGFGSPGQGRYLHPEQLRTLTPHEAARIQFIPDWFDFSSVTFRSVLANCIGNAVPPKLAFVVVHALLRARAGLLTHVDEEGSEAGRRSAAAE
jgi:DNA (cytosine-5)-methyltransferase 1